MTTTSFPHNSLPTVSRGVAEAGWRRFGRLMLSPGVLAGVGDELETAAAGGTRLVTVDTGELFVEGFLLRVDAPTSLSIAAADPADPRIDLVVARYDPEGFAVSPLPSGTVTLEVVTGTPAAVPVTPQPVTDVGAVYEVPLASVSVPAGTAFVDPADVQDLRLFSSQVRDLSGPTADRLATTAVVEGTRWFDTDLFLDFRWDGTQWLPVGTPPPPEIETIITFAIALGG